MKRSEFLRRLGIGAVAAVVAPKTLAEGFSQISTKNVTEISDNIPSRIDLSKPDVHDVILSGDDRCGEMFKYGTYTFNKRDWELFNDPNLLG